MHPDHMENPCPSKQAVLALRRSRRNVKMPAASPVENQPRRVGKVEAHEDELEVGSGGRTRGRKPTEPGGE